MRSPQDAAAARLLTAGDLSGLNGPCRLRMPTGNSAARHAPHSFHPAWKPPMELRLFIVDAFSDRLFGGNPAAVCPLEHWLPDERLQQIAAENNLSETAFFVGSAGHYALRWFTPTTEVDLCGHATLASAFIILNTLAPSLDEVSFQTRSGALGVRRDGHDLVMNFPAQPPRPVAAPAALLAAMGGTPTEVLAAQDFMLVYASAQEIEALRPDFRLLLQLPLRGVIATAPGEEVDFVSRFFAPKCGIDEDPVTGSAHCALTPYWAERLGKRRLLARQLSRRGGLLGCTVRDSRVDIAGRCVKYLDGWISVPEPA